MAYMKEDVRARVRRTNPEAARIIDLVDKHVSEAGGSRGADVTVDEFMTVEEQEMALFAGYFKEGYSPEESPKLESGLARSGQ